MNTRYKALIFDWDGTLADSTHHIVVCVQYAFEQENLAIPSEDKIKHIIGLSLSQAMAILNPNLDTATIGRLSIHYQTHYFQDQFPASLFPDAKIALNALSEHFILGIATGKGRMGLDRALNETKASHWFQGTRTVNECPSKPAPNMVLELCDDWGIYPHEALIIGDTSHDLLMAANAGSDGIGLTTGAHTLDALQKAPQKVILNNLAQLQYWLIGNTDR